MDAVQRAVNERRVAVLVDCDNVTPEVLEHALKVVAQFGRVVLRRGYGNHNTLANKWQQALVDLAFTPCLQCQYAAGKNTADIALALDALEALFDHRADIFYLVTSDSDFAYLCRKLRERGAVVYIVGEEKTPAALRNASDQFFMWKPRPLPKEPSPLTAEPARLKSENTARVEGHKEEPAKTPHITPAAAAKRRPIFIVDAVALLAAETSDGRVHLGTLGQYLKRTDPAFSPKLYGHSGLLDMIRTYDLLLTSQEANVWFVGLAPGEALKVCEGK